METKMEKQKIKIKVKKKQKEDIVKKPIKIKVKKRKEENVETAKLIKVYCAKKFYEKYLAKNETPTTFIQKLKFNVFQVEHLFKYNPDDLSNEELVSILLNTIDLNKILSLMFDKTINLKLLGIIDDVIKIGDKIKYLSYVCTCEFGYDLGTEYALHEITHRLAILKLNNGNGYDKINPIAYTIKAMKNGVIIDELSETDSPYQQHLKGCSFLVEYRKNKFINVPYEYYKRIYDIDKLTLVLRCCDSDVLYDYPDPNEADPDDVFCTLTTTASATKMKGKIGIVQDYLEVWDVMDKISTHSYVYHEPFKETAIIEMDRKEIVMGLNKFLSYYFAFLID